MTELAQTAQPTSPTPTAPEPLPISLTPIQVCERLTVLSQSGKLPGYDDANRAGRFNALFVADIFAQPFDRRLIARVEHTDQGPRLVYTVRPKLRNPAIYAIVLLITLWPGLPITDSIISSYSDWYAAHIATWWWYLPLMALCVPAVAKQARKSAAEAAESTAEATAKIAAALRD